MKYLQLTRVPPCLGPVRRIGGFPYLVLGTATYR